MHGSAFVVLLWALGAVGWGAGEGKVLVSYVFYIKPSQRNACNLKEWTGTDRFVCECAIEVRYSNRPTWVFRRVNMSASSTPVRCDSSAFPDPIPFARREICATRLQPCEDEAGQCRSNVVEFLRRGVVDTPRMDYLFSAVGDTFIPPELEAAQAAHGNVRVTRVPASAADLCIQGKVVRDHPGYSYYFLINCSARGPYVRSRRIPTDSWVDPFIARLRKGVHQVGSSVSCMYTPHAQSWAHLVDTVGAAVVAEKCFCPTPRNKSEQIHSCEVGVSRELLRRGHNIAAMHLWYQGWDFGNASLAARCNSTLQRYPSPYWCSREMVINTWVRRNLVCEAVGDSTYCETTIPRLTEAGKHQGCDGAGDPCDMVFVKYGGMVLRFGAVPFHLARAVEHWDRATHLCHATPPWSSK